MENYKPQELDNNEKDALERSGWKVYILHPTNLPITIAILYFLIFLGMTLSLPQLRNSKDSKLFGIFMLIPFGFLLGLSGFLNVIRKEFVRLRYIHRDSTAYLDGLKKLIVGWGGCVYMLYIIIFK